MLISWICYTFRRQNIGLWQRKVTVCVVYLLSHRDCYLCLMSLMLARGIIRASSGHVTQHNLAMLPMPGCNVTYYSAIQGLLPHPAHRPYWLLKQKHQTSRMTCIYLITTRTHRQHQEAGSQYGTCYMSGAEPWPDVAAIQLGDIMMSVCPSAEYLSTLHISFVCRCFDCAHVDDGDDKVHIEWWSRLSAPCVCPYEVDSVLFF
jgi:hypothetical protein